ncbi:hypothetical protein PVL29_024404 [Vitis rotundifolia]|uniref:WHEP-TRS domain-containing protein n=1 Tax=Vitis rotundifolia TaxID=103349 RepID=A0AA39D918_VITRO|nr:hypothetical protein PVL29_024404 [Vitis rotundifolia]
MSPPREALFEKQAAADAQGGAINELKASSAPKDAIDAIVQELNALKLEKVSIEKKLQVVLTNGSDNAHIIWIDNVNARLKALREIEAGEEF